MSIECNGDGNIAVQTIVDGVNDNSARLDAWSADITYPIGSFIYNGTDGFHYQALIENIGSLPVIGNANWQRWSPVNFFEQDVTKTIGTGGDYATLDEALVAAARWQSVDDAVFTLEIMDGHVIDYPINRRVYAKGIQITYAGAGSLVVNMNNDIATKNGYHFILVVGEQITFKDLTLSLTGSMDTSALAAGDWVSCIAGAIGFETCDININCTFTNHKAYVIRPDGWCEDVNITCTNINSPFLTETTPFYLVGNGTGRNINVDASNLGFLSAMTIAYTSNYFTDLTISNAVNCTYGAILSRTKNATIVGGNFRKSVSDDASDIRFISAIASVSATGGSNVQVGTFSPYGTRF